MAEEAQIAKATSKWLPSWSRLKGVPFLGVLAGAAVVAPFVLSSFRNNRRFDEDTALPMPKALSDPLPPVLEFNTPEPAQPAVANPHFGAPLEEGALGRRVRMQRAGLNAGVDVTPPNVLTPGDVSVIDGKPVTELSGKHVSNLQKDNASPSFGGPA